MLFAEGIWNDRLESGIRRRASRAARFARSRAPLVQNHLKKKRGYRQIRPSTATHTAKQGKIRLKYMQNATQMPEGSETEPKGHHQGAAGSGKGAKWNQRRPNGSQREPKGCQRATKMTPKCSQNAPKCHPVAVTEPIAKTS